MDKKFLTAVIVCVDYSDYLSVTLPRNRHHFREVLIVTHPSDLRTLSIAVRHECKTFVTSAFYDDGADFNKWLALELGLDFIGRNRWLCLLDADVIWPDNLPVDRDYFEVGKLYTPLRRMQKTLEKEPCPDCNNGWDSYCVPKHTPAYDKPRHTICEHCLSSGCIVDIPKEDTWNKFPIHSNINEWAGYTQIFHGADPVLESNRHWHQTNWKHAGGADSFFQQKWAKENKIRPPFEVLHLGEAGKNWCGRVSPLLCGEDVQGAADNEERMRQLMYNRKKKRLERKGLSVKNSDPSKRYEDPFAEEKI